MVLKLVPSEAERLDAEIAKHEGWQARRREMLKEQERFIEKKEHELENLRARRAALDV